MQHATPGQLQAGLETLRGAPADVGAVDMVIARPDVDQRVVLEVGRVTAEDGLIGDSWRQRGSRHTPDGSALPDAQLTLISRRWLGVLTGGDRARWPLCGDQFVVDLDLSKDNLQPGDRLQLGSALVEVTPKPHTGCKKFVARYGVEAQRLGASDQGMHLRLRGIYVRVVTDGDVAVGDRISRLQ